MRDPKRIDEILNRLKTIWKTCPDVRLGQLIGNCIEGPTLYYMEDKQLVEVLEIFYKGLDGDGI
jgi:hypothetical protein